MCVQGHIARENPPPPLGPCSRPSLGPYGGPGGGTVSCERGTPEERQRALLTRGSSSCQRSRGASHTHVASVHIFHSNHHISSALITRGSSSCQRSQGASQGTRALVSGHELGPEHTHVASLHIFHLNHHISSMSSREAPAVASKARGKAGTGSTHVASVHIFHSNRHISSGRCSREVPAVASEAGQQAREPMPPQR